MVWVFLMWEHVLFVVETCSQLVLNNERVFLLKYPGFQPSGHTTYKKEHQKFTFTESSMEITEEACHSCYTVPPFFDFCFAAIKEK
jgi:hypothetical protein